MSKLRLAIIGAGMISRNSHLPSALSAPRGRVTAVVDPVLDRARRLCRDFGIDARVAESPEGIYDSFDAAVIATPNSTHAPLAIDCLKHGKSVLIEKPLATSAAEGEAIISAAENSGALVAVGYSTRFRNSVVYLRDLLDRNHFGNVRRFVNRFGTPGGWSPMSSYNLNRNAAGGGVLVVTGTHFIDRMLYWWGAPEQVSMSSDARGGAEANCQCSFEYKDGKLGAAIYSKTAALPAGSVIETEAGYVLLGELDDAEIILRPHDAPDMEQRIRQRGEPRFPPGASSFDLQMDDFIDACLDGRNPFVGAPEANQSLSLIERLYESVQSLEEDWFDSERAA